MGADLNSGKDLPKIFSFLNCFSAENILNFSENSFGFLENIFICRGNFAWEIGNILRKSFLKLELEKVKIKAGFFVHSLHSLKALVF